MFGLGEKGFLVQIIVGAEYIACTHCLIIVGAAAPTEPMVPTLMYNPMRQVYRKCAPLAN